MNNLQKIKDVVYTSELSLIEQEELVDLFSRAKDSDLEGIAALINADTSMVKHMSDNYQAKMEAFTKNDPELWRQIIEKEKADLAAYAAKNPEY